MQTGFAVFFTMFELTRRAAVQVKLAVEARCRDEERRGQAVHRSVPRVAHAVALVSGGAGAGLAYELACRPWDIARKTIHINQVLHPSERPSNFVLLWRKLKDDGLGAFIRNPSPATHDESRSLAHRRIRTGLRTLARVGPWGVGFLVWESFGPGLV